MGMYYRLEPYRQNKIEENKFFWFPDTLSYFFEQVGGYEEFSEPSQIESLFGIDLSVFQITYHPEEGVDRPISTTLLIEKVETFTSLIRGKSELFDDMMWYSGSQDSRYKAIELHYEEGTEDSIPEVYFYPPNRSNYFTTGGLLKDLTELQSVLKKYKIKGIKEVQLIYS